MKLGVFSYVHIDTQVSALLLNGVLITVSNQFWIPGCKTRKGKQFQRRTGSNQGKMAGKSVAGYLFLLSSTQKYNNN